MSCILCGSYASHLTRETQGLFQGPFPLLLEAVPQDEPHQIRMIHSKVEEHACIVGKIVGVELNGLVDVAQLPFENYLEQLFLIAKILINLTFIRFCGSRDAVNARACDPESGKFFRRRRHDALACAIGLAEVVGRHDSYIFVDRFVKR